MVRLPKRIIAWNPFGERSHRIVSAGLDSLPAIAADLRILQARSRSSTGDSSMLNRTKPPSGIGSASSTTGDPSWRLDSLGARFNTSVSPTLLRRSMRDCAGTPRSIRKPRDAGPRSCQKSLVSVWRPGPRGWGVSSKSPIYETAALPRAPGRSPPEDAARVAE